MPSLRCPAPVALVAALVLVLLPACGGGGGDDNDNNNPPPLGPLTIPSTPSLDGVLLLSTNTFETGNASALPAIGDTALISGDTSFLRALFSFDLSGVQQTPTSATLSLFIQSTSGNPGIMMALGRVDHINFGNTFPDTFNFGTLLDPNFDQIQNLNQTGRVNLDVTSQVLADLASNRTRSQFRVRGAVEQSDDDPDNDQTVFTDGENTAGNNEPPLLILEFD